jgi:uncharacterized protein (TIGR00106 family)
MPKQKAIPTEESSMYVIADFCIVPLGVGVSLSPYVAACHKILAESGLHYQLHPNGTDIEGEWGAVMAVVRKCHARVHDMGAPRITSTLKLGTRIDREQTMAQKIASVESKLEQDNEV